MLKSVTALLVTLAVVGLTALSIAQSLEPGPAAVGVGNQPPAVGGVPYGLQAPPLLPAAPAMAPAPTIAAPGPQQFLPSQPPTAALLGNVNTVAAPVALPVQLSPGHVPALVPTSESVPTGAIPVGIQSARVVSTPTLPAEQAVIAAGIVPATTLPGPAAQIGAVPVSATPVAPAAYLARQLQSASVDGNVGQQPGAVNQAGQQLQTAAADDSAEEESPSEEPPQMAEDPAHGAGLPSTGVLPRTPTIEYLAPNMCYPQLDWAGPGCHENPHYVRGEYLLWWLTGDHLPPLVTTSTAGTPPDEAGILGAPGTSILFGNQSSLNSARSGGRLTSGVWLNPQARLEGEFFLLGGTNTSYSQNSAETPILAAPFYNVSTASADAYLFTYPGLAEGGVAVREISYFLGAGLHLMRDCWTNRTSSGALVRVGGITGFRYLGLYEKLTINSFNDTGTGDSTYDGFRTTNSFYGGNFGLYVERYTNRWTMSTIGRLGFGTTSQHANISGNSIVNSIFVPTGLYAYPSNMGSYVHDLFTILPQLELKLAYNITPRWRLSVGYDLLYWNRVARPGQQIDTALNPTQISGALVGAAQPAFKFVESTLLIQGVSTGLEFRY